LNFSLSLSLSLSDLFRFSQRDVLLIDGDHALFAALDAPALASSWGGQLLQTIYHFESILGAHMR
jgi:hypothetical protein